MSLYFLLVNQVDSTDCSQSSNEIRVNANQVLFYPNEIGDPSVARETTNLDASFESLNLHVYATNDNYPDYDDSENNDSPCGPEICQENTDDQPVIHFADLSDRTNVPSSTVEMQELPRPTFPNSVTKFNCCSPLVDESNSSVDSNPPNNDVVGSSKVPNDNGNGSAAVSNVLIRAKKRNFDGDCLDQELSDIEIVRFVKSSRPGKNGGSATMVSKIGEKHYKSSIKSISIKKVVYKCFDCPALTYCVFPETAISHYYDKRDRKRPTINHQFDFNKDLIKISSTKAHSCSGRKEESTSFLYCEMTKTATLIVGELQNPANFTADDILHQSLKAIYNNYGRATVKKIMESDPESQKHTRNFTDKIQRMLKKRRDQLMDEPSNEEDFSIYDDSIYQFDKIFYEKTSLKLFYDPLALKFLCDDTIEVLIDATFPTELIRRKDWIQLLKVKCFKKNVNALVFYAAMKNKTLSQYQLIFERIRELCQEQDLGDFNPRIVSTDQEASLINVATNIFSGAIYRTCSFHYIQTIARRMNSNGLKKAKARKNLKSSDPTLKYIARSWVILRSLPYLPIPVARSMIEYVLHRIKKLPESRMKVDYELIVEKVKADHDDPKKLAIINWWTLIKQNSSFTDTTTGSDKFCLLFLLEFYLS